MLPTITAGSRCPPGRARSVGAARLVRPGVRVLEHGHDGAEPPDRLVEPLDGDRVGCRFHVRQRGLDVPLCRHRPGGRVIRHGTRSPWHGGPVAIRAEVPVELDAPQSDRGPVQGAAGLRQTRREVAVDVADILHRHLDRERRPEIHVTPPISMPHAARVDYTHSIMAGHRPTPGRHQRWAGACPPWTERGPEGNGPSAMQDRPTFRHP